MVYCAAFGCNNDSRYNTSVSYHCFPSDKALQDEWLARISRADLVVTKHSRLCSLHFTPDDYERDLRAELTGRKRKRDLKTGVIPSIFSHRPAKKPRPSSEKRLEEKARQEVGPNKLYNYECKHETCTYLSHNWNKPWHKGQIKRKHVVSILTPRNMENKWETCEDWGKSWVLIQLEWRSTY